MSQFLNYDALLEIGVTLLGTDVPGQAKGSIQPRGAASEMSEMCLFASKNQRIALAYRVYTTTLRSVSDT